jgi:hypothetical protein
MTVRAHANAFLTAAVLGSLLASSCGRDQVAFSDIKTVPRNIPDEIRHPCGVEDVPGMVIDQGDFPAGVAYPTASHGSVSPGIRGIPTPEDSVQIDGFKVTNGRDAAVLVSKLRYPSRNSWPSTTSYCWTTGGRWWSETTDRQE